MHTHHHPPKITLYQINFFLPPPLPSDKVDWCNPGMGNPMIHRPMSDPGVFSQHQAMERESTGIVTPSGTFHQHVPAGYMDFPKVGVMVI